MVKKVLVFGSFDVLHPGHLWFLGQAKGHGSNLTVVIARDRTIKKIKGRLPLNDETTRLAHLASLPMVDEAVLGSLTDPYEVIERVRPDVICLGYDQAGFADGLDAELARRGVGATLVRLGAYRADRYKSSKLRSRSD